MNVNVEFDQRIHRESVVIPRIALQESSTGVSVFVIENNKAKVKKVTKGLESGTKIEILSGLTVGEKVVIAGQVNLKDGSPVSVVK